jgi:ABC-type lipoprotein export system ATPase subunit
LNDWKLNFKPETVVANAKQKRKINFPQIARVALSNFDIYSRQPCAEVQIERHVFCLIGANGLGKSTFLNTVNFVITGAVPDPNRKFQSAQEYLRNAGRADRTEDYFTGRISESSRPLAKATVELSWPSRTLAITRELFGGSRVSSLCIKDSTSDVSEFLCVDDGYDADELRIRYEMEVLTLTGLNDFAQFVFLLHFVSTFDEGRHLLMWDDNALTNALYLAFGTDPAAAQAADKLQHEMDRESSRGRNVRFAARHVADRINQLMDVLKGEEDGGHTTKAELQATHDQLLKIHGDREQRYRTKQSELRDADLKWTDLSASLTETQLEYRKLFSSRLQRSASVEHHPIIRATLSEDRCSLCGNNHAAEMVSAKLKAMECPLCDHEIETAKPDENAIAGLRILDEKIITVRDSLALILKTRDRISAEVAAAEAAEAAAHSELRAFEQKEADGLLRVGAGNTFSAIRKEIEKLEAERSGFLQQSEEHYKRRDDIREKLRVFEKSLKRQYDAAAELFVPRFRELAEEFIGLPVDVELEHRQGTNDSGFGLRLRMNEQLRLSADKLSESQRFFIDIALRMALSEFMASGPATLLIDTPEGSLDIAYEARAGSMFSAYVSEKNWILMTANLRSSELVLRLAQLQHKSGMQVVRMTDWTDLSKVQQSEEHLFLKAYDDIDRALKVAS